MHAGKKAEEDVILALFADASMSMPAATMA